MSGKGKDKGKAKAKVNPKVGTKDAVAEDTKVADKKAEIPYDDVPIDAVYVAADVSGSIRGEVIYPKWVVDDLKKLPTSATTPTKWILWGTDSQSCGSLEEVVQYLEGDECLGGTDPFVFIKDLPRDGTIDLHVYTDGEICEDSVQTARKRLAEHHEGLKFRRVVVNYVNKNLDQMNVGLSAIFDGHVLRVHGTRVADGTKLYEFSAEPLGASTTAAEILDQFIELGKTEEDMTKGMHYLAQRFANASPAERRDIRRLVKERADAVNEKHRTRHLTADDEKAILDALERRDWQAAKKPFVGHAVGDDVKLFQGYCQRFLNETKEGCLIRVSAYAPLQIKNSGSGAGELDELEEVLLDHIMFLGLAKEAVVVMPATMTVKQPTLERSTTRTRLAGRAARIAKLAARARLLTTAVKCALAVDIKANYDNTFGLNTLFTMSEQQPTDVVNPWQPEAADQAPFEEAAFVQDLEAGVHLRGGEQADGVPAAPGSLCSSAFSFGVNPFTRQSMECVLLVPASADALPADRLAQVDAWNAHMLSRFVRGGRGMPSVALVLALVLEKVFAAWSEASAAARPEDRAEAERLRHVWRRYVARMETPLTFSVALPVVIKGTFATAARLACAVLLGALDPLLPLDVLTAFWSTQSEEDAAKVWGALRPYAGLADAPFPRVHHRTLCALVSGLQYSKSGRDARLRAKKGRAYSVRAYTKRLDQLAAAGCHPERLAVEQKAVRKDLTGVAEGEPLLCLHGVEPDQCRPLDGQVADTLCVETARPTLLNKATMDMWYVGQPKDSDTLAVESFHKAMWQLVMKRTKGKKPRFAKFPPPEDTFRDYVNHRVRAAFIEKRDRVLPTAPCARLAQDIALTYRSYAELAAAAPRMTRQRFMKALRAPREVCAFNACCEYIREAVTEEQRAWIDQHATHDKVAGDVDVLVGNKSYRAL